MDYDENDFQSQNFQLGGEDCTKFPPGLQSYALPKFDLDGLHPHLRYDSLVETEVLLGIQNQEENHWIEDFSRESSGIEFSSSAAESCSISRRNNVWSEATSSESVEMLLKSVGQDEMLTKQTIIEESNVCDGLDDLNNRMDQSMNQDDSHAPRIEENVIVTSPVLPPDRCLENRLDSGTNAAGSIPHIEVMLLASKDRESGYDNLVDLEQKVITAAGQDCLGQKATLTPVEMIPEDDDHYVAAASGFSRGNLGSVASEYLQVDPSAASIHNTVGGATDGCTEATCCEKPESILHDGDDSKHASLFIENANDNAGNCSSSALKPKSSVHRTEELNESLLAKADQQLESGVLSRGREMSGHFTGSTLEETSISVTKMDKSFVEQSTKSIDGPGNPCSSVVKMDVSVLTTEGYSDAVFHGKSEDISKGNGCQVESGNSIKDGEIEIQFKGSKVEAAASMVERRHDFEGKMAESSSTDMGYFTSSVLKGSSATCMIHERRENMEIKDGLSSLGVDSAVLTSQGPESVSFEKDVPVMEECSRNLDTTLNILGDVLPDQAHYKQDLLGVDSTEQHISSPLHSDTSQKCDSSSSGAVFIDVHAIHSDVPVLEKEIASISTDTQNIEIKISGLHIRKRKEELSSHGQSTTNITAEVHSLPSEIIIGDKSAASAGNVTEFTSGNKLDATALVALDQKIVEKELMVTVVPTRPCLPMLENCRSHSASEPLPACDLGQPTDGSSTAKKPEVVAQSSSDEKSSHSSLQSKPELAMSIKVTQQSGKELEGHPTASVTTENDACEVLTISSEKPEATALQITGERGSNVEKIAEALPSSVDGSSHGTGQTNQLENEACLVSVDANETILLPTTKGDMPSHCEQSSSAPVALSEPMKTDSDCQTLDEPKCDSPTVISCSEPSQSIKECQGGGDKGSLDQYGPVSNDPPETPDINQQDDNVKSTARDPKENDVSEDDRSFTFVVGSLADLSERETDNGWKPFSKIQPYKLTQTVETSPTTSGSCQANPSMLKETSHGNRKVHDEHKSHRGAKGKGKDKSRLVPDSATENGTATGGKSAKETAYPEQTEGKHGKQRSVLAYSNGTPNRALQVEETKQYAHPESSITSPCSGPTVQTSALPDLNTSVSSPILFHQPFTDLQQVQLRAQIFVYGSLIQGTPPDESCMLAAFGDGNHDGGRSMWEKIWRVAVERYNNQKSPLSSLESPLHSRSGALVPELVSRCSPLQNNVLSTLTSRTGSKGAPPAAVNPTMSMSMPSPMWSFSTLSHDVLPSRSMPRGPFLDTHLSFSPLHPYQSPHIRPLIGNSNPWLSQALPASGSWAVSPQAPSLVGGHYSAMSIAEAVQVASVQDPSAQRPSNMQLASSSPLPPSVGPVTVNAPSGTPGLVEAKRTAMSPAKHSSAGLKPRKRKKNSVPEDFGHISAVTPVQTEPICATVQTAAPPGQTEPISATAISKHLTMSGGNTSTMQPTIAATGNISAPQPTFTVTAGAPVSATTVTGNTSTTQLAFTAGSPVSSATTPIISSTHYQVVGFGDKGQKATLSEETFSRIEQAKQHAEDAAAHAASAIKHSEGIWSMLALQKSSGLASDVEAKLASAAVAAAAAASVAKAAAAAAKVASDAALQAKLMADEALIVPTTGSTSPSLEPSNTGAKGLGKVTLTVLKRNDKTISSSPIIFAARETARKRIEAASAATKQAENLDAVMKAAELAAEAVSQAGTVIVMGDPIPLTLSELVDSGPENYWKAQNVSAAQPVKENTVRRGEQFNENDADEGIGRSVKCLNKKPLKAKEILQVPNEGNASPKELSKPIVNDATTINGKIQDSAASERGSGGQKGCKIPGHAKTDGVIPSLEVGRRAGSSNVQNVEDERHRRADASRENNIMEGSLVEVFHDEDGRRGVWFPAKVLTLKDGKAYICYNALKQDEGMDHLKEWIPLDGGDGKAPRIRIPHPMTAMRFERTRKRRRAAIGNYVWSVGDRVDALMQDGWWEGIVTEKSDEDETKLTVHFPARGDMSLLRAWNLRPSLIWKDGQWIEWSPEYNGLSHEGDTPKEKRQKLGRLEVVIGPQIEVGGKDKLSNGMNTGDTRNLEESRALAFSAKDKVFSAGKATEEKNVGTFGVKRTGLQKEGSRVIFGVPKPGKKRKFMDVSKHYIADTSAKVSEGTDSIKFAKYLMPQSTLGWKNSKIDTKGKRERAAVSKPKMPSSGKSQNIFSKKLSEKDTSLISATSASSDGISQCLLPGSKTFVSHDQNSLETSSAQASEGPLSVLAPVLDVSSSKKSSLAIEGNTVTRRKPRPARKPAKDDEKVSSHNDNLGKPMHDAAEPRRSNRRIQPTSRLLEGLQSSMIVSKIPSYSHGKGVKATRQQRNNGA